MEENNLEKDRAWIEIDLQNLENNIQEIRKIISTETKIMAVVKANAYGHDALIIAKKLSEIGINDFAVATLEEGINLRKNNIKGNILILGFTNFIDFKYVIEYDLIQTIIDYDYSEKIKNLDLKTKLKCHIKINTGMNRIGEKYDDIDKIVQIFENEKLNILGTFSHFCVADSNKQEDIDFSKTQIKRFNECIKLLKSKGYNPGLVHIQSSYGTINYSDCQYDYVRIGILMYGVNSSDDSYQLIHLNLKPVLSVKARITSIKDIAEKENVSYGRQYIAKQKRTIAAISIGYADGIPRSLSMKNMPVRINEDYGIIIGRICMDQLLVDITNLRNVKVGDEVTLIGQDKNIAAEVMAAKAGTITNELFCGLGSRLKRIVKKAQEEIQMIHEMKLQPKYFNYILNGTKRIEIRLYDEKRQQIKLNDTIKFLKEPELNESFCVKVVGLLRYNSFEDMFKDFDIDVLSDKSMTKDQLIDELETFYSKEKQLQYGVLGIKFELLD